MGVLLQIAQVSRTSSQADDLYLDDTGSGGYPEDDDDFNSGSGSGKPRSRTELNVDLSELLPSSLFI